MMQKSRRSLMRVLGGLSFIVASFSGWAQPPHQLGLTSDAFTNGRPIPSSFTCDGNNTSPPLHWRGVPRNAKSLALSVFDPDAPHGGFVHWVIYDIPANARGLGAGVPTQPQLSDGTEQGRNGTGQVGYQGPCPPSGTHHYYFRLYALNNKPNLPPGASLAQLNQAIRGHVIAQGQLMGTYARSR
jgi:Raf kinase inhibitor-like YbhB/YbcL family protein